MRKIISVAFLGLAGLFACTEQHQAATAKIDHAATATPPQEAEAPVDTSASFRIGTYWVTPDSSFDFSSLEMAGEDTLHIAGCQKYIIDPFGQIENKSELKTSLLKKISVKTKYVKQENGIFPVLILSKGLNKLVLYFDQEPDASASSYVFEGEINDSSVAFANDIRIGMSAGKFYRQFFSVFPLELERKYKVVVFDYCVDGIRHVYDIKNGRITIVKFSNPGSFWKINY